VRPVETVDDVIGFARPDQHRSLDLKRAALRVVQDGAIYLAPQVVFATATRVASIVLFFAFLTFPLVFWRGAAIPALTARQSLHQRVHVQLCGAPTQAAFLGCWLFAVGNFFAYLAVHYEHRYMAPALPVALIVAAWHLRRKAMAGWPMS